MFNLRVGPNYKKTGKKEPSGPQLYELHSVDFFLSGKLVKDTSTIFSSGPAPPPTGTCVPPVLTVSVGLPRAEPSMFSTPVDGECYTVVFRFTITAETRAALAGDPSDAPPAVRLLARWFATAASDAAFRGRFKAMCVVDDIESLGFPGFINGHNGKPVLITQSGTLVRKLGGETSTTSASGTSSSSSSSSPDADSAELHINVFQFNIIARKALHSMRPKFSSMGLNVAFTLEGRDDEDLPEVVLGCAKLNGLQLDAAMAHAT